MCKSVAQFAFTENGQPVEVATRTAGPVNHHVKQPDWTIVAETLQKNDCI
jgi:hypothetical protein